MPIRLKAARKQKAFPSFPEDKSPLVPIPQPIEGEAELDLTDPLVSEVWTYLGRKPEDYPVSQRVATLKREKYKTYEGTIPELVFYDWLQQEKHPFKFQAFVYGGRGRRGGVIPDFLVWPGGRGIAIFIDTLYWHSKPEVIASDKADRQRLENTGAIIDGVRVDKVISIWEENLRFKRPTVFQWAMQGNEMER